MIKFDIHKIFPKFILDDKNGYALAKGIEAALMMMCDKTREGIENVLDVSKMPEWRLDEMAWELSCLYDYNASTAQKRRWITDATPIYAALGTPEAIYYFLEGYFEHVEVEEFWQYGGEPFHFRITVSGDLTQDNARWAQKAANAAKNVRSVLDGIAVGSKNTIVLRCSGEIVRYPFVKAGTKPPETEQLIPF